jgi:hypothetical protein
MSAKKQEVSIKNKRPCPEKLQTVIDLINELPLNLKKWFFEAEENFGKALKEFTEIVSSLPKKVQEFIGPIPEFEDSSDFTTFSEAGQMLRTAYSRFRSLVSVRDALRTIASRNKNSMPLPLWGMPIVSVTGNLTLSETGGFEVLHPPDLFLEAFTEEGVEAKRIKECLNCPCIFWAGRDTMKGCSTRCANNIRVKRSYRLKKERGTQYNESRRKKRKKKNNPNEG